MVWAVTSRVTLGKLFYPLNFNILNRKTGVTQY